MAFTVCNRNTGDSGVVCVWGGGLPQIALDTFFPGLY